MASCRAQTFGNFELVIVDDGSTPPITPPSSQSDPRVRVLRHAVNRGVSAARNTGLDAARGGVIALLDSDDRWEPGHLAASLEVMEATGADLVYGQSQLHGHPYGRSLMYDERDLALQPRRRVEEFVIENPLITSTVVMRTELARLAGGWPERLRIGEDWWMYLNALRVGAVFAFQREPLVEYEWPTSATHTSSRQVRILLDRLRLVHMVRTTWPQLEVPTWRLVVEPFYRLLAALIPLRARRRLRGRSAVPGPRR